MGLFVELCAELVQPAGLDGRADRRHVRLVVVQVVQRVELRAQYLVALVQVVQVGAAVRDGLALGVERTEVVGVAALLDLDRARLGVGRDEVGMGSLVGIGPA